MRRSHSDLHSSTTNVSQTSSRSFLKYFGLDAYQKPPVQKLRPDSPRSSTTRSRSTSINSSSRQSAQSPVRDQPSKSPRASLSPRSSRSSSFSRKSKRVNQEDRAAEDFPTFWSRARSPSTSSTIPISEEGVITSYEGVSLPLSPTVSSSSTSWPRKFSLPLFPIWASPSGSEDYTDTPPLSPSTSRVDNVHPMSPTLRKRRPSMRSKAQSSSIESLDPFLAPNQAKSGAHDLNVFERPALPQFDFEARRNARSVDHDSRLQTVSYHRRAGFSDPGESTVLSDGPSRMSTFLDLNPYLLDNGIDGFPSNNSRIDKGDGSLMGEVDIFSWATESNPSYRRKALLRATKSVEHMASSKHHGSLHQQLSSFQFPNHEVQPVALEPVGRPLRRKAFSDSRPHDSFPPLESIAGSYRLSPPPTNPFAHPLPPSPATPSSNSRSTASTLPSHVVDPQSIDRLSHTSDSLEAAMAAIDSLADRSLDTLPIPPSPHLLPPSRPLSQLTIRTRKTSSQALSRRVFQLPSSRSSTPVGTEYESETASRMSTDTDASFLLAAQAISQQWPEPPRPQPRPRTKSTLSILRAKVLKRSKSTPTLLSPSVEYQVPTEYVSTAETRQNNINALGLMDPKLRYSVFVVDNDSRN